jgi:hypothetical protein
MLLHLKISCGSVAQLMIAAPCAETPFYQGEPFALRFATSLAALATAFSAPSHVTNHVN